MKFFLIFFLGILIFLSSCSSVRKSAGVTRKNLDEFKVVENPPLVIPPDFKLLPPEQLEKKNIDNLESNLAGEILFGLDEEISDINQDQVSTMNNILKNTNANETDANIREEIDKEFANEIDSDSVYQIEWETEVEILDAIKESERIRNQQFEGESIIEGDTPTTIQTKKLKKKKRFFFF